MPETREELKDRISQQTAQTPGGKGVVTGVQIGATGKAEPPKDFDPKAPKLAPKGEDPDADSPDLGAAERAARAKRRKAKAAGQASSLK